MLLRTSMENMSQASTVFTTKTMPVEIPRGGVQCAGNVRRMQAVRGNRLRGWKGGNGWETSEASAC